MKWIDRAKQITPDTETLADIIGKILTDVITCGIIVFVGSVAFSYPMVIVSIVAILSIFVRTGLNDYFNK
jgi:hypothetical protein